jgi:aryl carrier-like protein
MSLRESLADLGERQKLRALISHTQGLVAGALGVGVAAVAEDRPLMELGLDSVKAVDVVEKLGRELGLELSGTVLFDHPTIDGLCRHLVGRL